MSSIPQAVEVYSHDRKQPRLAGVLRPSFMGRSLAGASFEYDAAFIADGYALAPDRGELIRETSDFPGAHWVQAWIVKDGVAVATATQDVIIMSR